MTIDRLCAVGVLAFSMALQAEDSRTIRSLSKAVALRSYPNLFE